MTCCPRGDVLLDLLLSHFIYWENRAGLKSWFHWVPEYFWSTAQIRVSEQTGSQCVVHRVCMICVCVRMCLWTRMCVHVCETENTILSAIKHALMTDLVPWQAARCSRKQTQEIQASAVTEMICTHYQNRELDIQPHAMYYLVWCHHWHREYFPGLWVTDLCCDLAVWRRAAQCGILQGPLPHAKIRRNAARPWEWLCLPFLGWNVTM